MAKLIITGRTTSNGHTYIRFKASANAIGLIKDLLTTVGDRYFHDQDCPECTPLDLTPYREWIDVHIPVSAKEFYGDIIFGQKHIHFFVRKHSDALDAALAKYASWAKPTKQVLAKAKQFKKTTPSKKRKR